MGFFKVEHNVQFAHVLEISVEGLHLPCSIAVSFGAVVFAQPVWWVVFQPGASIFDHLLILFTRAWMNSRMDSSFSLSLSTPTMKNSEAYRR